MTLALPTALDGADGRPDAARRADVSVSGLAKAFAGRRVFRGVSFEVARGESVALLGANGAGKSTLLRCLVRLIEPDDGAIRLLDADMTGLPARRLRELRRATGFVFQRPNLVPRASVLTNVVHGTLAAGGMRAWSHALASERVRRAALEALDRVGLADLATRRADRLSGGQSQRVAIARALVGGPRLVLADEPAASLDPAAGEEIMTLLLGLARASGITVLFTTHNVADALKADRALGLSGGAIALDAPTPGLTAHRLKALYG